MLRAKLLETNDASSQSFFFRDGLFAWVPWHLCCASRRVSGDEVESTCRCGGGDFVHWRVRPQCCGHGTHLRRRHHCWGEPPSQIKLYNLAPPFTPLPPPKKQLSPSVSLSTSSLLDPAVVEDGWILTRQQGNNDLRAGIPLHMRHIKSWNLYVFA